MSRRWQWLWVLALLSIAAARPGHGQWLRGNEFVAGAALNVALRAPFVASGWRRPLLRLVLGSAISVVYEKAIDVNGWSWKDWGQREVSFLATEAIIALIRRKL